MSYFFTADTHFGHTNIIKYANRPFGSVGEMDEILIQNWNRVVKGTDTVFHLGDFCWGDNFYKYHDRLNGYIHYILGSHDKDMDWESIMNIYVPGLLDEYGNKRQITLCHYSMRSWPKSHYASWHLFGHHHGRLEPYGLSFDVGVDTNNYYPYSIDEISAKMKTLKPIVDFRLDKKEHS